MPNSPINAVVPFIPAISALGGVVVAGVLQMVSAYVIGRKTRSDRLADEAAARGRERTKIEARENYEKAILARHLEGYARACAETIWDNSDDDSVGASSPPAFPQWPNDIKWELIGAREMMKARDIEIRVEIRRKGVEGDFHYNASDESDAREIFSDGAARIGWEAWSIAKDMREEIGVEPFRYPDRGGNHAETLEAHVTRLEELARVYEERRAEKRVALIGGASGVGA